MELIVTLVLLAIGATIAGLSLQRARRAPVLPVATAVLVAARDSALRTRHPVAVSVVVNGARADAVAFPDGRVVADSQFDVDALTGRPNDAER